MSQVYEECGMYIGHWEASPHLTSENGLVILTTYIVTLKEIKYILGNHDLWILYCHFSTFGCNIILEYQTTLTDSDMPPQKLVYHSDTVVFINGATTVLEKKH